MSEHSAMLSCPCPESDRLIVICIGCGKTTLPDPSWLLLALSAVYLAYHLVRIAMKVAGVA